MENRMLLLTLTIFFAILCGVIASNKNRSIFAWILLGGFFSVFAFLILLAVEKKVVK
jgi:hypothetical protein